MTTWNEQDGGVREQVAQERVRFDEGRIVEYIRTSARTFESRVKTEAIAREVFGIESIRHGSAQDVALRAVLKDIVVTTGQPIGSKGGSNGGFWWMISEADRTASLEPLRSLEESITRRRQAVELVTLGA